MPNEIHFTKQTVDALPVPTGGKRIFYYDDKIRGLCIQITSNGTKTFYLFYRVNGQPRRFKLGECDWQLLPMERVRRLAEKALGQVVSGSDPTAEKREARQRTYEAKVAEIERRKLSMTFGELFRRYIDEYARVHVKTWEEAAKCYDRYFARYWGKKEVSLIQRSEVQRWVNDLADGKYARRKSAKNRPNYDTANRNFKTFRAVIRWGIKKDLVKVDRLPYDGIDLFYRKVRSRERFVQPGDERDALFAAINAEPDAIARDFFWMLLLTGARKSNVLAMRWTDLDFDRRIWRIPESKSGYPIEVPLTDVAIKVLERRHEAMEDMRLNALCGRQNVETFVFPGNGAKGHFLRPWGAWRRILKRAGLQDADLRIHDLRRTVGSYMAMEGFSAVVIAKTLGHRSLACTHIYSRLNQDPVRAALEQIGKSSSLHSSAIQDVDVGARLGARK